MEVTGGSSDNMNNTKNYSLGLKGDNGSVSAFVNGYSDGPKGTKFGAAGGNITVGNPAANIGVTGQQIPNFGKQLTGSANVMIPSGPHKVEANAFTTRTHPQGPTPSFSTHGGGVNYSYNDTFMAGASVANTPAFKHTQQSISTGVNLINTPNSSLSLNAGMNKTTSPFHNQGWQPGGSMMFKKQF